MLTEESGGESVWVAEGVGGAVGGGDADWVGVAVGEVVWVGVGVGVSVWDGLGEVDVVADRDGGGECLGVRVLVGAGGR